MLKVFLLLFSLLLFSILPISAQESLISVQTDDRNYSEGDVIVISGRISTIVDNTLVVLQIFTEGNIVDVAQITVADDGTYSYTIIAEGSLWKEQGDYVVRVSYGAGNIIETEFSFTPKSNSIETSAIFEVDTVSDGTFDVEFTINGGTVENIEVNSSMFGIVI